MKTTALKFLSLLGFFTLTLLVAYELNEPAGFFSRWTAGVYLKNFRAELAELLSEHSMCSRTLRDRSGQAIELPQDKVQLSSSETYRLRNFIDQYFHQYQVELESVWLIRRLESAPLQPRVRYQSHFAYLSLAGNYGGSKDLKFFIEIPVELTTGPWEARSILDCSAAKTAVP